MGGHLKQKGLRIKEKCIQLQALNIHRTLIENGALPTDFRASSGWLDRFKGRYNLVSRRQTTTITLPDNGTDISLQFIRKAQERIEEHHILSCNVINMDQVPCYFETEPKSTITAHSARDVLLRKGGSIHKRFTATFAITGDGQILTPHVLFSKLKKKPSCPPGILVDVSPTGMWSNDILLRHAKDVVCSRKETQFYRQPVLYIMDSYAAHIKMFNEGLLKRYNVFVLLVPPNFTNLLQPLDVVVNRSFQAFYRTKYDGFMGQALQDTSVQTKAGNPKVPHYEKVAQWVVAWAATRTTKDIARDFQLCGLVAKAEFSVYKLHPPLRELLSSTVNMHEWHQWYQHIVDGSDDHEELCISPPGWYLPDYIHSSLFCCLRHSLGASYADYASVLTDYIQELEELEGLFDDEYVASLRSVELAVGDLELFPASRKLNCDIEVIKINYDCKVISKYTHTAECATRSICVACIGPYFT